MKFTVQELDMLRQLVKQGTIQLEVGLAKFENNPFAMQRLRDALSDMAQLTQKLEAYEPEEEPSFQFPSGIGSYLETHHEIVDYIHRNFDKSELCNEIQDMQGRGGIWQLAVDLTNEFERKYAGQYWDGQWFERLWGFCDEKLKIVDNTKN